MGLQSIDENHFQVRPVARTLPGKQFDVGRMLRVRIAAEPRREGINMPTALETKEPAGTDCCGPACCRWLYAKNGRAYDWAKLRTQARVRAY